MQQHTLDPIETEAIKDAAHRCGAEIESYSGRYMYGETCLSVTVSGLPMFASFLLAVAEDDKYAAAMLAENVRTDSMGYDMVVYWPEIKWQDDESEK